MTAPALRLTRAIGALQLADPDAIVAACVRDDTLRDALVRLARAMPASQAAR